MTKLLSNCGLVCSCPEVLCKKAVLRNFAKFTGRHQYQSLFFNRDCGKQLAPVFEKIGHAKIGQDLEIKEI